MTSMTGDVDNPFYEEARDIIASLEPDNVEGYTVAFGHAFDGIKCEGVFESFEEALAYADATNSDYGDWHVVPLWTPHDV